jgi:two-component system phosphate regulon sensor histidine kinase PhoR
MKPSFGKRLTASYLFVVAVTLLFTGVFLTPRLRNVFLSQIEQSLAAQATLIAQDLAPRLAGATLQNNLETQALQYGRQMGYRVTIIRADGLVIGDSERSPAELLRVDNHLQRPEVQAALQSGVGQSIRHSATLDEDMLYVAVPVHQLQVPSFKGPTSKLGTRNLELTLGVLRVALPLVEVHRRLMEFQKDLLKAGAAALVVALGVALISVRRISQPLRELVALTGRIGSGQRTEVPSLDSRDEFGRLARAFGEMADRIEEKVGELSRERTQLTAILSALIEGVIALDDQGRILFFNPAAERLFGIASSEVKGRTFLEGLRQSPLNDVLSQALQQKHPITQEINIHTPVDRTLSVHALPVNYGEDHTGVLAALHDITELRKLENVRREFVANVSHELKTPLTSIKGYVETLLAGAIDDPKHNRAFLETIHEHSNHLGQLIDDVLNLSTIEAQRVTYRFEPVAVNEVAERIVKALEPMAKMKKVSISAEWPQALPRVRADREKLAQIMMNLLDNAIKFNKAGGKVRISAEPKGKELQIRIEDTGRGISPEDLPRVFERFYRGNKDRSHEIPGTGLGLAIVKHLTEAHQGTVTAQSVPGQGSTFQVTLPLA